MIFPALQIYEVPWTGKSGHFSYLSLFILILSSISPWAKLFSVPGFPRDLSQRLSREIHPHHRHRHRWILSARVENSRTIRAILSARTDNIFTFHLLLSAENYAIDPPLGEPITPLCSSSALCICSVLSLGGFLISLPFSFS